MHRFRFSPLHPQPVGRRATVVATAALAVLMGVSGCQRLEAPRADVQEVARMGAHDAGETAALMANDTAHAKTAADGVQTEAAAADAVPAKRFIAVRHELEVEAPAQQLPDVWAAVRDACGRLDCDLLGAELQRETAQQPVSASLTLRVAPKDHAALTQAMGGRARIINDRSSSEDKTAQVIDVEAHLKNRSDYRDSLRELLADKSVKRTLGELFEIRDTLSQVQAEIDSALTQRKLLEQETSKQFVHMQFVAERGLASPMAYNPWRGLWRDAAGLMAESARALVQVVAAVLPWAAMALLLGWPLRAWLRRRTRRRATDTLPSPAVTSAVIQPKPVDER